MPAICQHLWPSRENCTARLHEVLLAMLMEQRTVVFLYQVAQARPHNVLHFLVSQPYATPAHMHRSFWRSTWHSKQCRRTWKPVWILRSQLQNFIVYVACFMFHCICCMYIQSLSVRMRLYFCLPEMASYTATVLVSMNAATKLSWMPVPHFFPVLVVTKNASRSIYPNWTTKLKRLRLKESLSAEAKAKSDPPQRRYASVMDEGKTD